MNSANGWIDAFITMAIAASLPTPVLASTQTAIQIRLHVYARVSPGTLANAKAVASSILAQAGVHLIWAECRLRQGDPIKDAACELTVTPLDLQLRIIPYDMARRVGTTYDSLGYAWLTGELDAIASVYFHRAVELEAGILPIEPLFWVASWRTKSGTFCSANRVIMRANWRDEDLRNISKGRLWFTPEQGLRMAAMIRNREHAFKEYKSSSNQP